MKNNIILFCFVFLQTPAVCQSLIFDDKFSFLGYKKGLPIFSLFSQRANVDTESLYTIIKEDSIYGFKPIFDEIKDANTIFFLNDDIIVRGKWNVLQEGYEIIVFINSAKIFDFFTNFSPEFTFHEKTRTLFLFLHKSKGNYSTVSLTFNGEEPKDTTLPIKAYKGYVIEDYLYFSYFHRNDDYSPYPDDVFRVKIGDWQNPELVFSSHVYNDWFLYPESHVIVSDIDLGFLGNEVSQKSQILYNTESNSFAVIPRILTHNTTSIPDYLKYDGKYYGFFPKNYRKLGIKAIHLEPLPDLPEIYPYTEHEVLPREIWYNVPLREKTFPNTFITPYLLRKAPKPELETLDKSQLRLLRNAIYAQQAYIFQSQDLKYFFNQFEWYQMMTNRKTSNEDVVLLAEDEARAELIREIEDSK